MTVWVLLFTTIYNGSPGVIDDIATKEECVRIQQIIKDWTYPRCVQVTKVKR